MCSQNEKWDEGLNREKVDKKTLAGLADLRIKKQEAQHQQRVNEVHILVQNQAYTIYL